MEDWPMKLVQRHCSRVFRVSSQSRRRAQCLAATWPTNTGEPFSPRARLPAAYPCTGCSSNWSPSRCRPASKPREPQARPLAVASAHRPVSSPLAPPLPGSAPHLSALPASAARALAWRIALRRLAPVVALLFNVSARPVTSHCRHRPPRPTGGQPLHRAELLLRARAATFLLCSLSMHRLHSASLIPYCIESPPYPSP